ncbi:hypothetical protein GCM10011325_00950 [Dyadobacter sediminis]|nr:hypothetical protein GCM10011325_00950 [Dyadobacter sediminis]
MLPIAYIIVHNDKTATAINKKTINKRRKNKSKSDKYRDKGVIHMNK